MLELLQIEKLAEEITIRTERILQSNFPLDSRELLSSTELEFVSENDKRIVQLADEYHKIYTMLSPEEKSKINYKNIQGNYYQRTHENKGLIANFSTEDEQEIGVAFERAREFGKKSIDDLYLASINGDADLKTKSITILNICFKILNSHRWGKNIIEYLNRYQERLNNHRTVEDDLAEYDLLVEKTKKLSIKYAQIILAGSDDLELQKIEIEYKEIFSAAEKLVEFIPFEIRKTLTNLHWLKVDAKNDPKKVITVSQENDNFTI